MAPQTKVRNIVMTAHLSNRINLCAVQQHNCNVQYNPAKFNGLVMRLKKPKVTGLLFTSGSIVCLGAACVQACRRGLKIIAENVRKSGFEVVLKNEKICNRVFSGKLNEHIDFVKLSKLPNTTFEPEIFSGLTFSTKNGAVVCFHTGKFFITGCKTFDDRNATLNMFLSKKR